MYNFSSTYPQAPQEAEPIFSLSPERTDILRRLPQEARREVQDNINRYIDSAGKDYGITPETVIRPMEAAG